MDRSPVDLRILYEDNHIIAVNKAVGDLVQADRSGDPCLADRVKLYIRYKYGKRGNVFLGIAHRLDRPCSGVVLFARTSKALTRLNAMFRDNRVQKQYWAVVRTMPPKPADTLVHYLKRNTRQNKTYLRDAPWAGAKEARLSYRWVLAVQRYHLLEIELHTGRHHQIRAQLSAIGCPIKGDLKYGFPRSNRDGGIHLHARRVCLEHPVRHVPLQVLGDPPADAVWDAVRQGLAHNLAQ